jgi:hypothetical protein
MTHAHEARPALAMGRPNDVGEGASGTRRRWGYHHIVEWWWRSATEGRVARHGGRAPPCCRATMEGGGAELEVEVWLSKKMAMMTISDLEGGQRGVRVGGSMEVTTSDHK